MPKASMENFPAQTSVQASKKDSRAVLNMQDMNQKSNQLGSKINHCFGDFYKKLDTFADPSKSRYNHEQIKPQINFYRDYDAKISARFV